MAVRHSAGPAHLGPSTGKWAFAGTFLQVKDISDGRNQGQTHTGSCQAEVVRPLSTATVRPVPGVSLRRCGDESYDRGSRDSPKLLGLTKSRRGSPPICRLAIARNPRRSRTGAANISPLFGPSHLPFIGPAAARSQPAAASGGAAALRGLDRETPQSSKGRRKPRRLDCAGAALGAATS